MAKSKIGSGHLQAMARAGLKEVAQVLPAFPGHAVQPVEEVGLAGSATQAEVNDQKGTYQDRLSAMRSASPPKPSEQQLDQQRDEPER